VAGRKPAVQLEGAAELQRAFDKYGDRVQHGLPEADKRAAAAIYDEARRRAPVRSGRLLGSLRMLGRRKGDQATGVYVIAGKRGVPYARVIEFGWRKRHIGAEPYLYPSVAAGRDKAEHEYAAAIDDLTRRWDHEAPR
jgi:Bacteriophage HK97-gp10, putative tail-component